MSPRVARQTYVLFSKWIALKRNQLFAMGKAKGKTHHLADRCKDIMYFDNQVCFGTFVAITKICDNTWSGSINKWTIYTWMHRRVMVLLLVFSTLLWIPIQTSKQDISRKRYLRRWTIQNTKMDIPIIFDTTKFGVDFKENKIVFFNIKKIKMTKNNSRCRTRQIRRTLPLLHK